MRLADYLDRIAYPGEPRPVLADLTALLRAHVFSIPFENLDVQLGRRLTTGIVPAYEKIVTRQRGGWCYEQNGLFGWALATIGFDVTRVAASVMRAERGEVSHDNHLTLLVRCEDYLRHGWQTSGSAAAWSNLSSWLRVGTDTHRFRSGCVG